MELDQAITYRAWAATHRASPLRLAERPNPRHTRRASASAPTAEGPRTGCWPGSPGFSALRKVAERAQARRGRRSAGIAGEPSQLYLLACAGRMSLAVERLDARSWPESELDPLFEGAFPGYTTADQGEDLHRPGSTRIAPELSEHAQRPMVSARCGGSGCLGAPAGLAPRRLTLRGPARRARRRGPTDSGRRSRRSPR